MNLAYKIALVLTAAVCGGIILWDMQNQDADAAQSQTSSVNADQPVTTKVNSPAGASAPASASAVIAPSPALSPATATAKVASTPPIQHQALPSAPPRRSDIPAQDHRAAVQASGPRVPFTHRSQPAKPNTVSVEERLEPDISARVASSDRSTPTTSEVSTIAAIADGNVPTRLAAEPATEGSTYARTEDENVVATVADEELGSFYTPASEGQTGNLVREHIPATYTIQAGDSYSVIALRIFGQERMWVAIRDANPKVDPRKIKPGQVIRLPQPETSSMSATPVQVEARTPANAPNDSASGEVTADRTIHVVGRGETLSRIAMKYYRDGNDWRPIYEANRSIIGDNPNRVPLGARIVIP